MNDRWVQSFVRELTRLAEPDNPNRAELASLRRGLGETSDYTLARVGWLFCQVPDEFLDNSVLAAGLFSWVKGACAQRAGVNFGTAFGSGLSPDDKSSREKRFIDLLDTPRDELGYKLRQAITMIGQEGVALDWEMLIKHLGQWSHPDRWVQKYWARGFWDSAEKITSNHETETVESTK